jgi:hypothetical protein
MNRLQSVDKPRLDSLSVQITPPAAVQFIGMIAIPDPGQVLGVFFAAMHEAVTNDGLREVSVDVRQLTFVNSSAIRLFVDWATWVRDREPTSYVIRFRTDRRITWQRTSFSVLQSLAPNAIVIDSE